MELPSVHRQQYVLSDIPSTDEHNSDTHGKYARRLDANCFRRFEAESHDAESIDGGDDIPNRNLVSIHAAA
jgi:hypothetical protein